MIYFDLFITFFLIGLLTFGGGYAMIPMIQEQMLAKNWLTLSELTDFIAISEATPGPFAINISTFVGNKMGGALGALCSTLGIILPSFIIILIVSLILNKFLKNIYVKGAISGVRPIVFSLILSTCILFFVRILLFNGEEINFNSFTFDRSVIGIICVNYFIILSYKKINKKSLNMLFVLLISAILGLILYT